MPHSLSSHAPFTAGDADIRLRGFQPQDASVLKSLVETGWGQFAQHVHDWPAFLGRLLQIDKLAENTELIVAERGADVLGFVGYAAPGRAKAAFFDQQWASIRMLTVSPAARGQGVGRLLTEACLQRAASDGATVIGLHTSPSMQHALDMYLRLGFTHTRALPELAGLEYHLYALRLA